MIDNNEHIRQLFRAELQFRLASAVHIAVSLKCQPLDLPVEWVHGIHQVRYEEIALRGEQAEYAASFLHRSTTFLMAVAMKDAISAACPDPKASSDANIVAAYQVSRLIRNAFAHAPFNPIWRIDPDCQNKVFAVPEVISLDTTGLDKTPVDWRHYGGPLALFHLCRFVRFEILGDVRKPRTNVPARTATIYQQGDLIMQAIDELPEGARPIQAERLPDGGIPLGGGYVLYLRNKS